MNTRALLFCAATAAILAALFFAFRPPATPTAAVEAPASAAAPRPVRAEFVIENGVLLAGPQRIEARQGDAVELRITSDQTDELHLHGYDLEATLQPGTPATLRFTTDRAGRFELELHRQHLDLGALEVAPAP